MTFEKSVLFLGMQALKLSDGTLFHQVQFYDRDGGPVSVNVMGNQSDMLDTLKDLDFGSPVTATFVLRPKDKCYRLVLDHVS